jgi:hypothetical protein
LQVGVITVPVNHDLFEIWHVIEYDAPVICGSKTVWVGKSSVNIKTTEADGVPTDIGMWSEKHWYEDADGSHLEQAMLDVIGGTLPPQGLHFRSMTSSSDKFFKINNKLTGYAKITALFFGDPAGLVEWVPLPLAWIPMGLSHPNTTLTTSPVFPSPETIYC